MIIFAVENQQFGWDEIVIAAEIWGEWQPFVAKVRQSLACLRHARKLDQLPSADELHDAATAFRYAHNLISAEETRAWLSRSELTTADWMDYLRGQLLREGWSGRLREIVGSNPVSDEAVAAVIKDYAVCADKLSEWAVELAGRAAVAARSGGLDAGNLQADASQRDLVLRIEAEFERQRELTITPKLIEARIADHRLDWIHYDCRYVWFGEERLAREAAWCVTEDGLTLEEVAYDARGIVQQWNFYLDEIDASARPHFLGARQGDRLGPLKMLAGFTLFSVDDKRMPQASDSAVSKRAEQAIIASFKQQSINERVKWATLG
jgi:hypothetical protein